MSAGRAAAVRALTIEPPPGATSSNVIGGGWCPPFETDHERGLFMETSFNETTTIMEIGSGANLVSVAAVLARPVSEWRPIHRRRRSSGRQTKAVSMFSHDASS